MAKEQYYPYAIGRIRVIEKNFLTYNNYVQMAEAKTPEEAMRLIVDAGYGYSANEPARNFELLLSQEMEKTYNIMNEMLPDTGFFSVFLDKIDFHNMKVLLKKFFTKSDSMEYLIQGGKIAANLMEAAIESNDFSSLPELLGDAASEALEMYRKTGNGQLIDIILDKAAFSSMVYAAKKSGSKFLTEYVSTVSDLTNIKSFMRMRKMKKLFHDFSEVYIPGGELTLKYFEELFESENPIARLMDTKYSKTGLEALETSFTEYEKNCDNYLMGIMKKAKFETLALDALI
ncbi:MAG: V-type ATPase subunit, partial [Clostridiales bacterium]|nr:V-type ATPase subunit [Clostridiales bacterium]